MYQCGVADLAQLDLNLLHTFLAVVKAGGVHRAARILSRTQPAISTRLKKLEASLGVRLFQRAGRGLELSPEGRVIAREAEHVLAGLRVIVDHARSSPAAPRGVLRVGALTTVTTYLLAPVLASLVRNHPALELEIEIGLSRPHLADLLAGRLDVVFSVGQPPDDPRLSIEPIGTTRAVAVLPAASRRDRRHSRRAMTVAELSRRQLLGFGKVGDAFFDEVWAFLERRDLARHVRVRAANIQTLKALVAAGCGVTVLPDYTVQEPELTSIPIAGLPLAQPIWMAVRRTSAGIPAVTALASGVREALARPT